MTKKELELENELLRDQIDTLIKRNRVLSEAVYHYANPLVEWDKGAKANGAIKLLSKSYKPVNSEIALMFKEKKAYPFVEFEHYIPTDDEDGEFIDE